MRKRRQARELALQILYAHEVRGDSLEDYCVIFWQEQIKIVDEVTKSFCMDLVQGVKRHLSSINKMIIESADNWEIDRMAVIDKSIIRLAAFELMFDADIPPKVSINEAIDIAKKYGDLDSGKFVNGILDKIKKNIESKFI